MSRGYTLIVKYYNIYPQIRTSRYIIIVSFCNTYLGFVNRIRALIVKSLNNSLSLKKKEEVMAVVVVVVVDNNDDEEEKQQQQHHHHHHHHRYHHQQQREKKSRFEDSSS